MIAALIMNTFREAIRNRVLYSVLLFVALLVAISALFGAVTIGSQVKVIKDFGLFALSFFGAISCIATPGGYFLNKELKQKTIYNILSKAVPRWKFVLGKLLGLYLTTAVLTLAGFLFIAFAAVFEGQLDPLLFQGLYLTLLEVLIITGITIFFSSLVITTSLAGLFTVATYIAGRSLGYLTYFTAPKAGSETNPVTRILTQTLDIILPNLGLFNVGKSVRLWRPCNEPVSYIAATIYAVCYTTLVFLAAAAIFQHRELN